jgi:hypothetical protein
MWVLLLFVLIAVVAVAILSNKPGRSENYNVNYALQQLERDIGEIKEVGEDKLHDLEHSILMVAENKESFSFFSPINARYWPQYYYSFPFTNTTQGSWPPGMYTNQTDIEPGYSSGSGWKYAFRPGVSFKAWQRSRWVKNNGMYYFINNGTERDRLRDS